MTAQQELDALAAWMFDKDDAPKVCHECEGKGWYWREKEFYDGEITEFRMRCPHCAGTGKRS